MQQEGGAESVRALVEAGADIQEQLSQGWAPLCCAFLDDNDCREIVNILLQAGADVNLQDDDNQCTALHEASKRGLVATVRLLLASGADPDIRDCDGEAALHYPLQSYPGAECSLEVVSALCEAGADVNAQTKRGKTPL
ncbi:hypothetical protein BOTBODRAFT_119463, partial [Botryobasidium botryosum FD-172 SS1]